MSRAWQTSAPEERLGTPRPGGLLTAAAVVPLGVAIVLAAGLLPGAARVALGVALVVVGIGVRGLVGTAAGARIGDAVARAVGLALVAGGAVAVAGALAVAAGGGLAEEPVELGDFGGVDDPPEYIGLSAIRVVDAVPALALGLLLVAAAVVVGRTAGGQASGGPGDPVGGRAAGRPGDRGVPGAPASRDATVASALAAIGAAVVLVALTGDGVLDLGGDARVSVLLAVAMVAAAVGVRRGDDPWTRAAGITAGVLVAVALGEVTGLVDAIDGGVLGAAPPPYGAGAVRGAHLAVGAAVAGALLVAAVVRRDAVLGVLPAGVLLQSDAVDGTFQVVGALLVPAFAALVLLPATLGRGGRAARPAGTLGRLGSAETGAAGRDASPAAGHPDRDTAAPTPATVDRGHPAPPVDHRHPAPPVDRGDPVPPADHGHLAAPVALVSLLAAVVVLLVAVESALGHGAEVGVLRGYDEGADVPLLACTGVAALVLLAGVLLVRRTAAPLPRHAAAVVVLLGLYVLHPLWTVSSAGWESWYAKDGVQIALLLAELAIAFVVVRFARRSPRPRGGAHPAGGGVLPAAGGASGVLPLAAGALVLADVAGHLAFLVGQGRFTSEVDVALSTALGVGPSVLLLVVAGVVALAGPDRLVRSAQAVGATFAFVAALAAADAASTIVVYAGDVYADDRAVAPLRGSAVVAPTALLLTLVLGGALLAASTARRAAAPPACGAALVAALAGVFAAGIGAGRSTRPGDPESFSDSPLVDALLGFRATASPLQDAGGGWPVLFGLLGAVLLGAAWWLESRRPAPPGAPVG